MEPFTAVSYNVRHAVLDDDENCWSNRRDGVISRLQDANPDIIALQECVGQQHTDIAVELPDYEWVGVADTPGTGEHNPIGYGPRLTLTEARTVWLSESGEPERVGWDAAFPRAATEAQFRDDAGKTEITAYSLHFDHRGERARLRSAGLLRRRIDSLPKTHSVILMGDCNATPGDPAYNRLVADGFDRQLIDSRELGKSRSGPATTHTDFEELRSGQRIDHIFVTQDVTVSTYTIDATKETDRYPSDHLPVVIEFRC
jgi:endonuclease/exonuclease/phosphatase family metal-dependent hydrolase